MKTQNIRLRMSWGLYRWLHSVSGDVTEWSRETEAARVDRPTAARVLWMFRRIGGHRLEVVK